MFICNTTAIYTRHLLFIYIILFKMTKFNRVSQSGNLKLLRRFSLLSVSRSGLSEDLALYGLPDRVTVTRSSNCYPFGKVCRTDYCT